MATTTPNDPLFAFQWGLLNTGQAGGTPGMDIDVSPIWPFYTGLGVTVAIADTGVQLNHPDLAANIDVADSFDAVSNTPGGNPVNPGDNHGTPVAGIVGAVQNNGIGTSGVAPRTTLISYRILGTAAPNDGLAADPNNQSSEVRAFNKALADEVDVVNNSWGFDAPFASNFNFSNSLGAAETSLGTLGRDTKGAVLVFSAGNSRASGADANLSNMANSRFAITVAALLNTGKFADYSNPGADLLVSAPAGTNGIPTVPGPATTATDRTGADGYNTTAGTAGDYTNDFDGTSAAGPFVSGVVALMLQANPNLGYRDVQQILAYTARNNDPTDPGWITTAKQTWNGGGSQFNLNYGFGLVDAAAAVRMAESYVFLNRTPATEATLGAIPVADQPASPLTIAAGDSTSRSFTVPTGALVNHIDLDLGMVAASAGSLTVTLTSPGGTSIKLLSSPTFADTTAWPVNFTLGTDAFLGENTGLVGAGTGNWTLTITNTGSSAVSYTGSLLQIGGANPGSTTDFVYTDEFATLAAGTPARQQIAAAAGTTAVVNASPLSGSALFDLAGNTVQIGGQTATIAAGTVVSAVLSGDGNDTLVGTTGNHMFSAGRGANLVLMGDGNINDISTGQDTIAAGAGADTVAAFNSTALIFGSSGSLLVGGSNATETLSGGSGMATVYGGRSGVYFMNNGQDTFVDAGGSNTIVGGTGADTIFGGVGSNLIFGNQAALTFVSRSNGGATIVGGTTKVSVFGSAGTNVTYFGAASAGGGVFATYGGNETLNAGGSFSSNLFSAGAGTTDLIGGSGSDTLFAGTGNATMTGGSGSDLFVFTKNAAGGTDFITDLSANDAVVLNGYGGAGAITAALNTATTSGSSTTITLSDATRITFGNVASLNTGEFRAFG